MRKRELIIFLNFLTLISISQGPFKNLHKKNTLRFSQEYKDYFFAYYDLVHETGLGYERKLSPYISAEIHTAYVYPHSPIEGVIGANDFFYNTGYSISFFPKFYFPNRHIFYGPTISYINSSYKKMWAEPQLGYDKDWADQGKTQLRDRKSKDIVLTHTIGLKIPIKKVCVELFSSIGIVLTDKSSVTTYKIINNEPVIDKTYNGDSYKPYMSGWFYGSCGIKVGMICAKNTGPVYKTIAKNYNTSLLDLDNEARSLFINFQISNNAIDEYEDMKHDAKKDIKKAQSLDIKDTLAINDEIKFVKENLRVYLKNHSFKKGTYCDTIKKKDGRIVLKRKKTDLYDHRHQDKWRPLYETHRLY